HTHEAITYLGYLTQPMARCGRSGDGGTRRVPAAAAFGDSRPTSHRRYRHNRKDRPRPDPGQLDRAHALSLREGQEGQERVQRTVREVLAAADHEAQTAWSGRLKAALLGTTKRSD